MFALFLNTSLIKEHW